VAGKNRSETQSKDSKYKVVSLFSGAMGLDIGLEETGRFELLACVEKEHAFVETIRMNHRDGRLPPGLKIFENDINELDPADVLKTIQLNPGEVDVIVGGPPCQSFSTAGKRRTTQDPRGTLLWQFLRFVEVMQPKFFLMENVRGLLSAALQHRPISQRPGKGGRPLQPDEQPGSVVRLFAEDLQKMHGVSYHVDIFEVNAVNYGAPQLRERVLFIGNRYNTQVDFPDPTHGSSANDNAQKTLFDQDKQTLHPWRTLGDAINSLKETDPVIMDFSPRKKKYLSMVAPGSNWRSLPIDVQKESMASAYHAKGGRSGWWRRLSFDLPCPTLVTMPNHAGTSLCHPAEVRALTLREYARIQEFPDDWEFFGTPAQQYTQVGNAVPVRLGRIAGEVISSNLDILKKKKWKAHPGPLGNYRIVYVQSHVRTRQWFKDGETIAWNDGGCNGHASYAAPKTLRKCRRIQGM
jgi:DNA (cytosine-5)-methyltransferase 1